MSARSDRRAHQPWVREVQQLKRRGVVNQGDDVTVVVLPKKKSLSAFRGAMRVLGMCGVLMGFYIAYLHPGANHWLVTDKDIMLRVVAELSMESYFKYAGPLTLVLCLYAALKDGLLSALGVLVLLFPAGLIIGLVVGGLLLKAMGNA